MTTSGRRLWVASLPKSAGETVTLDARASRHVAVLRLGPGAAVVLFDGAGGEVDATLSEVSADGARCVCAGPPRVEHDRPGPTLVLATPKGAELDRIVRAATELGVRAIHLATTERTVARPGATGGKLDRVRRIVREAARQSEQPWVPQVHAPAPWFEVVRRPEPHAHRVLCWARGGGPMPALEGDVWVAVGPEGGFTPAEIAEAERGSFVPVRLTDRVLRVETAVVVALGLVTSGPTHA